MTDQVFYSSNKSDTIEKLVNTASPDGSADDTSDGFKGDVDNLQSEDELDDTPVVRPKRRVHHFTDSSSESEYDSLQKHQYNEKACEPENSSTRKTVSKQKSRIRTVSSSDDDLSDTAIEKAKEKYDLSRVKNKKTQLREKFLNLVSKQDQHLDMDTQNKDLSAIRNNNVNSDKSDEEQVSCNKIKQTFKDKHMMKISAICDPDSSSDEDNGSSKQKKKSVIKSTRFTSPKPIKISAKQAMENKQKIKSESNRMLREKEVSLPYHRPKALSLKDIMNRRKPALAPDGKVLSVKMTPEQLEQYALQLEQRQKEMMELCKSDTEEDDEEKKDDETEKIDDLPDFQIEQDNKTSDTQVNTGTEPMEIVEDDNLMDNATSDTSGDLKSTECIVNAENMDVVNKDSNEFFFQSMNEIESTENKEILEEESVKDSPIDEINNAVVNNSEKDDSQNMELHYDSEKIDTVNMDRLYENKIKENTNNENQINTDSIESNNIESEFLDNDFSFDEIDAIMQNVRDKGDSNHITEISFGTKPKLTGAPGMVIDLDNNTLSESKLSGIEQLKERFKYFARLKSLEEQEKDREKKYKPGVQLLKLKQELEEQIAEQRSLEWAKRLEQEKQQQLELNEIQGDDLDDIEKVEAKLEQLNDSHISKESSDDDSEEICEDDCIIEDKPRKKNPMIDEEAEESDVEDPPEFEESDQINEIDDCNDASDEESSEDESSESDDEGNSNPKKGRILKAFEDSDDEEKTKDDKECDKKYEISEVNEISEDLNLSSTQDEELQLAQVPKTSSEEIISQVSVKEINSIKKVIDCDQDLGSQTFSIANTGNGTKCFDDLLNKETHIEHRDVFMDVNLYTTNASQNIDSQELITPTQSQEIGDDILAMCTGKFYDNPFVSQIEDINEEIHENNTIKDASNEEINNKDGNKTELETDVRRKEKEILSSILEELDNPQFESPKKLKYFVNDDSVGNKENVQTTANESIKKKLIIDSDDEVNEGNAEKIKKKKKRKLEQRALQFSDDDEEMDETEDLETDNEGNLDSDIEDVERIVEYDSEENEVEVQPQKKKKKIGDFFEQEAELTSEDEWIGSGDEDEAGLDRMEREEGDDDVFHEGKLRKELGQIHMRDVLDQDKREVRLLQELLFEDGDLGEGHRQRKFRWKNADEPEEGGAGEEFADTQEEEFESEELWRKQRHEREMFLRKMKGEDEDLNNTSINRNALIKANLSSKATSPQPNKAVNEDREKEMVQENRINKDVPSSKKPFAIFQKNYPGSLLSRGKGALARLAAIAAPLAGEGDTTKVSSTNRRNFVFAALSQDEVEPKVSKRKADTAAPSPVLIKKLKAEERQKSTRSSLFDYLDG